MYDLIVIGAGPAGISASLYARRGNLNVLVLHHGKSNLEGASQIDNYYGFENGISGKNLYDNGIKQAMNLGVEVRNEETLNLEMAEDNFKVITTNDEYVAKSIVISTGNKKFKPQIPGVNEFEGKGISYCAVCDGFFYRNKTVAVIGNGNFAINEAKELQHVANKVSILTNGLDGIDSHEFDICSKKIKEITGSEKVRQIVFEDGKTMDIDGIFIALGEAGGIDFAKKIGILTDGDKLRVNENMETNIPGIYACGDITGGLLQVCKSVYDGAVAGLQVIQFLRGKS